MAYLAFAVTKWYWVAPWGGLGLLVVALIDNSFVPLPGGQDIATVLMTVGHRDLWVYYAAMSTVGSAVGGYLTYRVARKGGREMLEKKVSRRRLQHVYRLFERWGFGTVFVSAILPPPFPTVPFLAGAGALNYPVKKFLVALTLSRVIRYTAVAYLASLYGLRAIRFLMARYTEIGWVVAVGAAAAVGVGIAITMVMRRKSRRPAR